MRVGFALAVAVLFAATAAQAQSAAPSPALAKVVAAAESEGKIVFRATNTTFAGATGAQMAADGINRMFGTHLTVDYVPGARPMARSPRSFIRSCKRGSRPRPMFMSAPRHRCRPISRKAFSARSIGPG